MPSEIHLTNYRHAGLLIGQPMKLSSSSVAREAEEVSAGRAEICGRRPPSSGKAVYDCACADKRYEEESPRAP
ncbi:MAG: hypothetical protein ACP5O0_10010 [Acidimicrobiales bacterium]